MLFAKGVYGCELLRRSFDTIPIDESARLKTVSRFLDVTETTLKKWLSGKATPPRAAVIALWHESHLGRSTTAAHSEEGTRLHRAHAASLQAQVQAMQATIDRLNAELERAKLSSAEPHAMNEPIYNAGRPAKPNFNATNYRQFQDLPRPEIR